MVHANPSTLSSRVHSTTSVSARGQKATILGVSYGPINRSGSLQRFFVSARSREREDEGKPMIDGWDNAALQPFQASTPMYVGGLTMCWGARVYGYAKLLRENALVYCIHQILGPRPDPIDTEPRTVMASTRQHDTIPNSI
jgi:hypothetical protein